MSHSKKLHRAMAGIKRLHLALGLAVAGHAGFWAFVGSPTSPKGAEVARHPRTAYPKYSQAPAIERKQESLGAQESLLKEITLAPDAATLLDILDTEIDKPVFDGIHLSASFSRLAKLASKRESLKFGQQVFGHFGWNKLKTALTKSLEPGAEGLRLDRRGLVNVFWSLAHLQREDVGLWQFYPMLVEQILKNVSKFNAQQLSNCLWALKELPFKNNVERVLQPLVVRAVEIIRSLTPQHVCNILSSAASLSSRTDEMDGLLPLLAQKASEQVEDFAPQALANVVWSAGVLSSRSPELKALVPTLMKAMTKSKMASMSPQMLSTATFGCALSGYRSPIFLGRVSAYVGSSALDWNQRSRTMDVPQFLIALVMLEEPCEELLDTVAAASSQLENAFDWSICALEWSLQRVPVHKGLKRFREEVRREVERRSLRDAVRLAPLGPFSREWRDSAGRPDADVDDFAGLSFLSSSPD